jgi:hypothetical protein
VDTVSLMESATAHLMAVASFVLACRLAVHGFRLMSSSCGFGPRKEQH